MNKMSIKEAENRKSIILLDMGVMIYQKIRNNEIKDESFNELSKELLEIDKIIYEESIKEKIVDEGKRGSFCECGNLVNKNDKFCVECGSKLYNREIEEFKICDFCDANIALDSNYCVCCGNKINKIDEIKVD